MFVSIPIRRAHQSASSSADNDIIALTKKLLQDQKGSFTFRANRTFSIYLFLSFQDNLSVGARRGGLFKSRKRSFVTTTVEGVMQFMSMRVI